MDILVKYDEVPANTPRIGFFSPDIEERAHAMASLVAYKRKWKWIPRDLTPYTDWWPNIARVELPENLLPDLNAEAQRRIENKRGPAGRQDQRIGRGNLDMMGVRGEAAWCIFLGLDPKQVLTFDSDRRKWGDLNVPNTPFVLEVKTCMTRMPNPHMILAPSVRERNQAKASAYCLAMPDAFFPKDLENFKNFILVGWQRGGYVRRYAQKRQLGKKAGWSIAVDELKPPRDLKERLKRYQ